MALASVRVAQSDVITSTATVPNTETTVMLLDPRKVTDLGRVTLLFNLTIGSLTNATIQAYTSEDGTNWFLYYTSGALTGDTKTAVELVLNGAKHLKVTVKSSGTRTSSALTAKLLVQLPVSNAIARPIPGATKTLTTCPNTETDLIIVCPPQWTDKATVLMHYSLTLGSLTNATFTAYASDDGSTWYQIWATAALSADTTASKEISAPGAKLVKLTVKSSGTRTSSAATGTAYVGSAQNIS